MDNGKYANTGLENVDVDVFAANTGTSISNTHAEANIGFKLIGGDVSAFSLNMGLGFDIGGGIKDDSLKIKALECGF